MRKAKQRSFEFQSWGGSRAGAGRKSRGPVAGVAHEKREEIKARHPVHVTLRLTPGPGSLRKRTTYPVVNRALVAGSNRFGFRLVQYAVMTNHLHLVCEVDDSVALARGIKGLTVRIASALNLCWKRSGPVFADRYHAHVLKTPCEVRNALRYVLRNAAHHGVHFAGPDPSSTARWFEDAVNLGHDSRALFGSSIPKARTWLLIEGWRRRGSLPPSTGKSRT